MIVSEKEARRILGERKTQHRIPQARVAPARLATVNVQFRRPNPFLGYIDGEPMTETVTMCRVTVAEVTPSELAMADLADAQREGCRSVEEMLALWEAANGRPKACEPVWVLDLLLDRRQRPRFLSRGVIAGVRGDYASTGVGSVDYEEASLPNGRTLRAPVEAVDDFTLERYAREARDRHRERMRAHGAELAAMDAAAQLPALLELARRRAVDVRDEARQVRRYGHRPDVVDHQLAQIRSRLGLA